MTLAAYRRLLELVRRIQRGFTLSPGERREYLRLLRRWEGSR